MTARSKPTPRIIFYTECCLGFVMPRLRGVGCRQPGTQLPHRRGRVPGLLRGRKQDSGSALQGQFQCSCWTRSAQASGSVCRRAQSKTECRGFQGAGRVSCPGQHIMKTSETVYFHLDPDNPPTLTAEERQAWEELKATADGAIDFSDLPLQRGGGRRAA